MTINSIIKINDYKLNNKEPKRFLIMMLSIQFAIWGLIGLTAINMQVPILRQLIGLIYLLFVPGSLIIRFLKLNRLGNIEAFVYTVGLSCSFLMFIGFFINAFYPIFGILRPISIVPLMVTMSIIVLILSILCYIRGQNLDSTFYMNCFNNFKKNLSPLALFLCMIPILTIFGNQLATYYNTNILLMMLIFIIALIPLIVSTDKLISKDLYPFIIFIIAISLLYHISLVSPHIIGWDIHHEYYLSNLVVTNSSWNSAQPSAINAMLSIVILAPIFSIICDMELVWVFKLIYPLLFALSSLGFYMIFLKQTNEKIAFLSTFFFMAMFRFYYPMPRQNIAEYYMAMSTRYTNICIRFH